MLTDEAHGVYPIAPTPFHPDGSLDLGSVDRLAAHYLACGADGVTVLGIMGEAPKLEPAEALAVAARFIAGMQGRPVIVGVSSPGFAAMRSLARAAMDQGAAGVMIAPAPHLRTDDEIVGYFAGAADAIGPDVPWVLQDYPLTLSVVMTPEVIRRIVMGNAACVMLKHEDWPGLEKISALRRFQAEGSLRPLSILTGNGGLFLDFEMERGADGAMTGYAFPEMLIDVVRCSRAGDRSFAHDPAACAGAHDPAARAGAHDPTARAAAHDPTARAAAHDPTARAAAHDPTARAAAHDPTARAAAHDAFDAHLPLLRYEQQPRIGLAVRKYVLMRRGLLASDAQRAPAATLSDAARAEVDFLMARLDRARLDRA